MYKHILIATDGSALASRAVAHGVALANDQKAAATIVTVTESWSAFELAREARMGNPNPLAQYETAAANAAKSVLDKAAEVAKSLGVPCNLVHVPDQHPAEGIVATAKAKGCDLIVMASHGRRGVDKVLIGSRTQEVVTNSPIPVLVVH